MCKHRRPYRIRRHRRPPTPRELWEAWAPVGMLLLVMMVIMLASAQQTPGGQTPMQQIERP